MGGALAAPRGGGAGATLLRNKLNVKRCVCDIFHHLQDLVFRLRGRRGEAGRCRPRRSCFRIARAHKPAAEQPASGVVRPVIWFGRSGCRSSATSASMPICRPGQSGHLRRKLPKLWTLAALPLTTFRARNSSTGPLFRFGAPVFRCAVPEWRVWRNVDIPAHEPGALAVPVAQAFHSVDDGSTGVGRPEEVAAEPMTVVRWSGRGVMGLVVARGAP